MMSKRILAGQILLVFVAFQALAEEEIGTTTAQDASGDKATDLAKQVQDPLSGLILLPLQYNYAPSIGPLDKPVHQLLIEPTFPIKINDDWKILTHTIIPYVSVPAIGDAPANSGLGNVMFSALLARKSKGHFTMGYGAGLMFPTASDTAPLSWTHSPTGFDCWAAGPSVVGVYMKGQWVGGVLVNQNWSFGSGDSDLNAMQIQGFLFYNLKKGFSIGYEPLVTIDWNKPADQSTTVPIGLQAGKLFMIGGVFPLGTSVGAYYNVIRPDVAPKGIVRVEVYTILPEFW